MESVKEIKAEQPSTLRSVQEYIDLGYDEQPWIVEHLLPAGTQVTYVGPGGVCKTTFLVRMAEAIAGGENEFCGFTVKEHGKVVMLSAEDGKVKLSSFFRKYCQLDEESRSKFYVDTSKHGFYDRLIDFLEGNPDTKVLILDNFLEIFEGDNNKSEEQRRCLSNFHDLCEQYGITVVWINHVNKWASKRANVRNVSGGQGFVNANRAVYEVQFGDSATTRVITVTKSNIHDGLDYKKPIVVDLKMEDKTFSRSTRRFGTKSTDPDDERNQFVLALREQEYSQNEILEMAKAEGIKISAGTIAKILKGIPKGKKSK